MNNYDRRIYSPKELEQLLFEFRSGTPLSEVGDNLNRSPYGIALKMLALSKQDPNTWKPEKVGEYTRY